MFWDNYRNLCEKEKKSPNKVAAELGIASGTVTGWKNGALPRKPVAEKIADYFDVTTDYLLGETAPFPAPAAEDPLTARIITLSEQLSKTDTGKARLKIIMEDLERAAEREQQGTEPHGTDPK